jgi:hypothetical protein
MNLLVAFAIMMQHLDRGTQLSEYAGEVFTKQARTVQLQYSRNGRRAYCNMAE